jgi:hypothetical protein
MRERYIAPAIMLAAGAITSVFNIVNEVNFLEGLKRLLLVLILFYILGKVATIIISKATKIVIQPEESDKQVPMNEDPLSEDVADDVKE